MMAISKEGRLAAGTLAALALVGAMATPASADSPRGRALQGVRITAVSQLASAEGTFAATGRNLCPKGTTSEPNGVVITEGDRVITFDLDKRFTCADGSGTFTMRIHAWFVPCHRADHFVWALIGGTGRYARLAGGGTGTGTYIPGPCDNAEGIVDVFRGVVGG